MLPEIALLFALSEQIFQVCPAIHILTYHSDPVGVVHRFVEKVTEELDDVGVVLSLEQLDRFFLRE